MSHRDALVQLFTHLKYMIPFGNFFFFLVHDSGLYRSMTVCLGCEEERVKENKK